MYKNSNYENKLEWIAIYIFLLFLFYFKNINHQIIYKLLDAVEESMLQRVKPEYTTEVIGEARVKEVGLKSPHNF